MLSEMIGYHRWAVDGLLVILFLNLVVPFILRDQIVRMIFWVRIGYFTFWAFWATVLFAGLIVWMFTHQLLPTSVILMIVAVSILPIMDGYRAIKLKRLWLQQNDGVGFNAVIVGLEIILTISVFFYGIYGIS